MQYARDFTGRSFPDQCRFVVERVGMWAAHPWLQIRQLGLFRFARLPFVETRRATLVLGAAERAPSPMLTCFRNITPAAFATFCLLASGCASAGPHPKSSASTETTDAAATQPAAPTKSASTEATEATAETVKPAETATPADEPRDGLRKASRPPLELLTGNNVVYVLNFSGSKVGESAKERCENENGQDPSATRECVNKQRSNLAVESIRFVKDPHGQYWWVTYNRYKGNLLKWHRIQFLPGKADDDSITLNLTGKDKGIAPLPKVPTFLKVELPNDYSIVVSDPNHGPLVFDAKIGLMDQE